MTKMSVNKRAKQTGCSSKMVKITVNKQTLNNFWAKEIGGKKKKRAMRWVSIKNPFLNGEPNKEGMMYEQ